MQSYLNLLRTVLEAGENHDDRTGVGTLSTFGMQWNHCMENGFPLLTTKKLPLRWVFEELKWFLSGSTNEGDLRSKGVDIWKEWATKEQCAKFGREEGDLGPVYGYLWRSFEDIDQIKTLLEDIDSNPNSRRLIVTGWHPAKSREVALPPCHTLWQVKVHEDKSLSLKLYMRSCDIFLGLPFNIASYALLLEMLCWVFCRKSRNLIVTFGDLHLYKNHINAAKNQLAREPRDLPKVTGYFNDGPNHLETLLSVAWTDITLTNYKPHPSIKAEIAI